MNMNRLCEIMQAVGIATLVKIEVEKKRKMCAPLLDICLKKKKSHVY